MKNELFKKELVEHDIKRSRKESRTKGYRQGYNRRLWYHLLHKAVKYGARLFRSILDEEAVRKIFTSIYTRWPLFSFLSLSPATYAVAHVYTHVALYITVQIRLLRPKFSLHLHLCWPFSLSLSLFFSNIQSFIGLAFLFFFLNLSLSCIIVVILPPITLGNSFSKHNQKLILCINRFKMLFQNRV